MEVQVKQNKIYAPLIKTWVALTPEEQVRQEYVVRLVSHYGFSLDQMAQDHPTKSKRNAFVDIVVWKSSKEKDRNVAPLIVVECKAQQVTIRKEDYFKGAAFASKLGAKFLVTTNQKQTRIFSKIFKVDSSGKTFNLDEIINIPKASIVNDEKEINTLLNQTVDFAKEDFSRLLFRCHNIIRNNDKLSPEAAFDEISKILFIKTIYERKNERGQIFLLEDYLSEKRHWDKVRNDDDLPYYRKLFENVKKELRNDEIFEANETLKIRDNSFEAIVKELEVYNLSTTSDDVKGIAFEKFLGRTFRGELGQFFTPRTIVDYMVELLDPEEGEKICDPCCGSGGFLIKAFEYVRAKIESDIQRQKDDLRAQYMAVENGENIDRIDKELNKLNLQLDVDHPQSRIRALSHESIYGSDANPRMARTAKMNMIMHGDGHGGVHHHDGLINVNGIFEERFDVILTNPPFGARVEKSLRINYSDIPSKDHLKRYVEMYGESYLTKVVKPLEEWANQDNGKNMPKGRSVINLFETGEMSSLTEVLFLERCLNLLKPGGRMGIVLPEGVLNNTALERVREYIEGRAQIINITSIPQDVFIASGATIKPSLLFLKKFTKEEKTNYERTLTTFLAEKDALKLSALTESEKKNFKRRVNYQLTIADVKDAGITTTGAASEGNEFPAIKKEIRDYWADPKNRDFRHIKIGEYSDLVNWSVSHNYDHFLQSGSDFPSVSLKEFLIKNNEVVKIDDRKEYKRITIRINNNGIVLRDIESGKNIGTKRQFVVRAGQFAISKIDARNGAIGIIPQDLDGAVVTPDFLTYNINKEIVLPEYLELITSTNSFVDFCRRYSSGTTNRQRLNEKLFLNAKIPIPPIEIQRVMIEHIIALRKTIAEAETKLQKAKIEFEESIFKP